MFTGIITEIGTLASVSGRPDLKRLRISWSQPAGSLVIGASVAVNGVCLTAIAQGAGWFETEAAAETLACTTAGSWAEGKKLNLERPLKVGDELGGHLVAGHVDGVATVIGRDDLDGMLRLRLRAPADLVRFIAPKGSVVLDGISLTVNQAASDEFTVLLIPHTLAATSWSVIGVGDRVNVEVDLVARYVARLADAR